MSSLQIGRLLLGPPLQFYEPLGDPVTNLGGAVVPNTRTAPTAQVTVGTIAADGQTDTPAARLVIRRQLRSLLNNSPMKFQGYIYLLYSDDPENNGWYVPDQTSLQDISGSVGLATGFWQLASQNWMLAGHMRTHREARLLWLKDLRTGLFARDALGWIYSTDFSALPAIPLTYLPSGATGGVTLTVTAQTVPTVAMPTGQDGGICRQAVGLADVDTVAYERPEASLNLSDVIVYDRMGSISTDPTASTASWVEVYGPDWQANWLTAGQPNDTPVLSNGLVRVRYDAAVGNPGFRVDVWTGSAWAEQGKMTVRRVGDSAGFCDTWVAATLREWTPDRAVISVVLSESADVYSREQVYVTMQRGQQSVRFECYPAPKEAGTLADVALYWTPAAADVNDSIIKVDSQSQPPTAGNGKIVATAGTGSSAWSSGAVGASSFSSSENYVAILRCSATSTLTAYQTDLIVLQAANAATVGTATTGYGATQNVAIIASSSAAGYVSVAVCFSATEGDQVLEAESITLGTGTTNTTDAAASNGHAATATRTTDANAHATRATWPNAFTARYRVFARVKVSAGTGSFYAKTSATTGTTVTTTSTTYVWIDLGEIKANGSTFETHAWISTGSGTVSVDRIEAFLTEDQTRTNPTYSGARDQGQAALYDSRALGALVART